MRFYGPDSGELFIDGRSIQTLDINWLRNNITLVQQQSVLFNETILKNIAFGRTDHDKVKKEELKRSIETAFLQYTISDLPHGLDTIVGTGGNAMSGGQQQRVAIARARLRDTPILILDEATSALDHISRTSVMEAIREWRRGKTTIIITHDMSQIQEEEYTYVLDKGTIVQEGFKQILEKAEIGPFEKSHAPEIEFPLLRRQHPRRRSKTSSISSIETVSSGFSIVSKDSMDIHFPPRASFIPSMFGPSPEGLRSRRVSQSVISPLSPVAFPSNRMSTTLSTFAQFQRKNSHPINSEDHLPLIPVSPLGGTETMSIEKTVGVEPPTVSGMIASRDSRRISILSLKNLMGKTECPTKRRKLTKAERAARIAPIKKILMTVWPILTWKKRITLIWGFFFAAVHAAATPTFSWVFSKLLATFFLNTNRSQTALKWSLSVLGVAIVDTTASFLMHYLLEACGQAWIDTLRIEALKRILDQPRPWFDRDENNPTRLIECLDRNAEEMRNLVGRFAGFVFVAINMMALAVIWSLILCWKLTLVGLASAPILYAITRAFESVSGNWERKSNDAGEVAGSIFAETFVNIRVVRALTLEGYFHEKYAKATNGAMKVGFERSAFSGFFFGLSDSGVIFVTGWFCICRYQFRYLLIFQQR